MTRPSVVIIGAGYAGTALAAKLQGQADIIVIEKNDFQDHAVAGLRAYAKGSIDGAADNAIFSLADALPYATILQDTVTKVEAESISLSSGVVLSGYDYLVIATGSHHAIRVQSTTHAEAQVEYETIRTKLLECKNALIVGGGPVAVEMAGELGHAMPELALTLATSGKTLLDTVSHLPSTRSQPQLM